MGSRDERTKVRQESDATDDARVFIERGAHSFSSNIPNLNGGMRFIEKHILSEHTLIFPSCAPIARSRPSGLNSRQNMRED